VQCEFITDMLMLGTIIALLQINKNLAKRDCGIPIVQWLDIFFMLFGLRSLYQLMKIWVIRHFYSRIFCFDIAKLVFVDGFMVAWLVYGNYLYYSPKNNCAYIPDTQFMAQFMSCIIILGYMMMFMYLMILVSLPCLYIYFRHQMTAQAERLGPGQIP
jgi:hypothetical protein